MSETDLTKWTVRKLKQRAVGLYSSIYQSECFSSHDIRDLEAIEAELNSRGYVFNETKNLSIDKV